MRASTRATLGLGVGLVATAAAVFWILRAAVAPTLPLERKFRDADREVLYEVASGSRPRLALARGERRIFLVTHAIVRPDAPVDGAVVYGLGVRLTQPGGEVLLDREVWTRSRRSRATFEDGLWLEENAFTAEGLVLADDRVIELALPESVEEGAILQLSPVTSERVVTVLFRAYRLIDLADATSDVRRLALTDRERERLAGTQGVPRWEALPEDECARHVATGWQRMPALGEDGVDYETRPIFYTGFRSPRLAPDRREPRVVDAAHFVAWNVEGPASLQWLATGAPVELRVQSEQGAPGVQGLRSEASLEQRAKLKVGAGVHTVTARLESGRASVQLSTTTLSDSVPFGDSLRYAPANGERLLAPDLRWLPAYHTDGSRGLSEVCWTVDGEGDFHARTVRLDVRALLPEPALVDRLDPVPPVEVAYRFVDAAGRPLVERAVPVEGERAPFESVRLGDDSRALTTEPVELRFVAPRGAASFCARTATGAALRALTLLPGEPELDPRYEAHQTETVRWRYAPMRLRAWLPLRAIEHPRFAREGRLCTIVAQTRLESLGSREGPAPGRHAHLASVELEPQGRPARYRVLEVVEHAGTRRAPTYVALTSTPVPVRGLRDARETRGLYWLERPEDLGATLAIDDGSSTLFDTALRANAGPFTLAPLGATPRALALRAPASARVFVEGAPADGRTPTYAQRTVFQLSRAAPVRLRVPGVTRYVWVVLYAEGADARADLSLRMRLDEGEPRYEPGVPLEAIRRPERVVAVPASDRPPVTFVDRRDVGAARPRIARFSLGDGLAAAEHTLDVWVEGSAREPIFARFLVEPAAARGEAAAPVYRRVRPAWEADDD